MMIEDSVVAALQSVTMTSEIDIYRSASVLIKQYGDRAESSGMLYLCESFRRAPADTAAIPSCDVNIYNNSLCGDALSRLFSLTGVAPT